MQPTPTRRLADALLSEPLDEFVASRRGQGKPWRLIARELWAATDGQIDITEVTLQNWYRQSKAAS